MIYGYIRVSTDTQTVENQKMAIREYAKSHRLHHIIWTAETISGTKQPEKRKLGEILRNAQEGDTIIITELSRLGRSLMMILDVLQSLLEKGVKVIAIKEGYELGDNIQSKVLAFAFGLSAELERTLLSERTKLGLERARKQGKRIGRQFGEKPHHYKLTPYRARIKRYIKEGRTINSMAEEFHVSWLTMKNFVTVNIHSKPLPPLTEAPRKHGYPTYRELEWFRTHA